METTAAQLAAELARQARTVDGEVAKVVKRGAVNIKRYARASVRDSRRNRGKIEASRHINFDISSDGMTAEVGYDKPAGAFGNLNEFGGARWQPNLDLAKALERETPNFEKWVRKVAL